MSCSYSIPVIVGAISVSPSALILTNSLSPIICRWSSRLRAIPRMNCKLCMLQVLGQIIFCRLFQRILGSALAGAASPEPYELNS